jgi:cytochrome c oxidase subunit 2
MKITTLRTGIIGAFLMALIIGTSCMSVLAGQQEQVVKMTAKRFEYSPKEITLKKGVPAVLEITALDRLHGFDCPDLGIRADLLPGKVTKVRFTPQKTGNFTFHCDIFCGDGHEDMAGTITVRE